MFFNFTPPFGDKPDKDKEKNQKSDKVKSAVKKNLKGQEVKQTTAQQTPQPGSKNGGKTQFRTAGQNSEKNPSVIFSQQSGTQRPPSQQSLIQPPSEHKALPDSSELSLPTGSSPSVLPGPSSSALAPSSSVTLSASSSPALPTPTSPAFPASNSPSLPVPVSAAQSLLESTTPPLSSTASSLPFTPVPPTTPPNTLSGSTAPTPPQTPPGSSNPPSTSPPGFSSLLSGASNPPGSSTAPPNSPSTPSTPPTPPPSTPPTTTPPSSSTPSIPALLPIVPIREGVLFPSTESVLTFGRTIALEAIHASLKQKNLVILLSQKKTSVERPTQADLYQVGTLAVIERTLNVDNQLNALVRGISRVLVKKIVSYSPYLTGEYIELEDTLVKDEEFHILMNHLQKEFKKSVHMGKAVEFLNFMKLMSGVNDSELIDQIASTLNLKTTEKQEVLEMLNVKDRLSAVVKHLDKEIKILEIEKDVVSKTQEKFDKHMRENVLRERLRTIQQELGEIDDEEEVLDEYQKKLKKTKLLPETKDKVVREMKRLRQMSVNNPEGGYVRTWLDTIFELPWGKYTKGNIDLEKAEKVLDKNHYGLKEVKDRIIEYIAVLKMKQQQAKAEHVPTILCFVGAPGVGKTSIGRSIAESLGRKFVKISLGGVRDEAEIRGHRRTYVGAMPGRIISGMKQAQSMNPVFMLDEIDKIGQDFRGDPAAALLEVLDPEQNKFFEDHYLDTPFDLSQIIFITTANTLETIPSALLDRLEVIRYAGYTQEEKMHIATDHLLDKVRQNNALSAKQLTIPDSLLQTVIERYTKEAGVRNLERELNKIMRKAARQILQRQDKGKTAKQEGSAKTAAATNNNEAMASSTTNSKAVKNESQEVTNSEVKTTKQEGEKGGNSTTIISLTPSLLATYLGPAKYDTTQAEKKDEVGLATGLAWTSVGGDVLFIEVALTPGKGEVKLTGQLGDVMKESAQAAMTYVQAHAQELGIDQKKLESTNIHVHVPEGAVPKDGPSAGITLCTAIVSAYTQRPTRRDIAMTGEITLRGRVMRIGGLKEKSIAAHQAGVKTILIPKENERDLVEVPDSVKKTVKFIGVETMDQVLERALRPADQAKSKG